MNWTKTHQRGFDAIAKPGFTTDPDLAKKSAGTSQPLTLVVPRYFSGKELSHFESAGKVLEEIEELEVKINAQVKELSNASSVKTEKPLQNKETNPEKSAPKSGMSLEKPLPENSSVSQASSSKTIRSWEKPLKERYATSADKDLAEAREKIRSWEKPLTVDSAADQPANSKKIRSWERPLEERYATSADKELAEARKKLFG